MTLIFKHLQNRLDIVIIWEMLSNKLGIQWMLLELMSALSTISHSHRFYIRDMCAIILYLTHTDTCIYMIGCLDDS